MDKLGRILMVEDDPKDVELSLMALEEYNLANEPHAAGDHAGGWQGAADEFPPASADADEADTADRGLLEEDGFRAYGVGGTYAAADLAGGGQCYFCGYGQEGEDAAVAAERV
jgi:hypothetical protein